MNFPKEILITGSASEETIEKLQNLFHTCFNESEVHVDVMCKNFFNVNDLKQKSDKNWFAIIYICNLSPRPETLMNDTKILTEVFSRFMLKQKTFFFFKHTSDSISNSLNQFRNGCLEYNSWFRYLDIQHINDKTDLVDKKIWFIDTIFDNVLKKLIKFIENECVDDKSLNDIKSEYERLFKDIPKSVCPIQTNQKFHQPNQSNFFENNEAASFQSQNAMSDKNISRNFFDFLVKSVTKWLENLFAKKKILVMLGNIVYPVSVTKSISLMTSGNFTFFDCPGFGDPSNETIFFRNFLSKKEQLLNAAPIDAFLLVTKFDRDESGAFLQTAEHFVKSFGKPALKSLIILCLQGSPARRYSDSEFDEILKQTSGYTYLKSSNSDNEIKYLLWENIYAPYPNQRQNFDSVRKSLPKYSKEQMEMAFDLVENRAEFIENK
jgi:hypothetical protein